ncbi:ATP-grasp domain-containing protein [Enterovirga aerilata]|uniref:ATP-grasp domain-containing protein n=1 Tax=Enterovirga aerilata TaxID=2730920 RepID=A0A849ICV8_9HYPH|nr:ATP-grasp domain-containing protein [Enterovirga sp. DB1703]NNM74075.1 ATP-grasp domain-containing protein [Enterovirga sp. DB1703]
MLARPSSRRRALILADGFRLQYRVLRCAAEHFAEVYVLGTAAAANLRLSLACCRYLPAAGSFENGSACLVDQINVLCREHAVDLILPSCAATTRFLAAHGEELAARHFPVPAAEVFDILDDKWTFTALCGGIGVPVPRSRRFETRAELLEASRAGELEWPIVVKPLNMWGSFGVARLDGPAELEPDGYEPILVQEYVAGRDICAVYLCSEGRVLVSVSYARTQQGLTFLSTPAIDRSAEAIVSHLGCSGVIGFDLRCRPDGSFVFIECNPRFWYRMDMAALAGLNFVALGCGPPEAARRAGRIAAGTTLRSPTALLAAALAPWHMSRQDLRLLRYLARDPVSTLLAAFYKLTGQNRFASGQMLACLLALALGC